MWFNVIVQPGGGETCHSIEHSNSHNMERLNEEKNEESTDGKAHNYMVVYSWDDEGVGVAHDITSPDGEAVLIGKIKPNQAYRLTLNSFKRLLQIFKNSSFLDYSTDWLCNWLMLQTSVTR